MLSPEPRKWTSTLERKKAGSVMKCLPFGMIMEMQLCEGVFADISSALLTAAWRLPQVPSASHSVSCSCWSTVKAWSQSALAQASRRYQPVQTTSSLT